MPAKGKGASSKKSGAKSARKTTKPKASRTAENSSPAAETQAAPETAIPLSDAQNFTRGVLIRGEAAKADESGQLPPGATHEIVGEDEEGMPLIERRRFSAF